MGDKAYVGFAIVMGMAFLFGTLVGFFTGEWRETSRSTKRLVFFGLAILILSTIISGLAGNIPATEIPSTVIDLGEQQVY